MTRAPFTHEEFSVILEALALLDAHICDEHIDHQADEADPAGCDDCRIRDNRMHAVEMATSRVTSYARVSGIDIVATPSSIDTANYTY